MFQSKERQTTGGPDCGGWTFSTQSTASDRNRRSIPQTSFAESARIGLEGARIHVASMSRLFRKERTATNPEFCKGFEILLVTASNCVFLPTFNAETILSRRVRLDLHHKRGIHKHRSMDPNESVWLQLFCHHRDGLAQQIGVRFPLQ